MHDEAEKSFAARLIAASPLGLAAVIIGLVLTIGSILRFGQILDGVEDDDLAAAIQALGFTVIAVWIGFFLWGWYLIKDGVERARTAKRIDEHGRLLGRIHEAISERDAEQERKKEQAQSARSFWNWRRNDL